MNSDIVYYDWVPFFNAICNEINVLSQNRTTRKDQLYQKAVQTFKADHAMFKYKSIDPFSYVYALAQKNTVKQHEEIFGNSKVAFGFTADLPTDEIFPTPMPIAFSLFYSNGNYIDNKGDNVGSDCLWDLFDQVFNNKLIIEDDFEKALSLKNVGFTKLTQAIFLINPENYIPFDTQMNSLPINDLGDLTGVIKKIDGNALKVYHDVINKLRLHFPGLKMYEVNLLNVFLNYSDHYNFKISNKFCQISSWAQGQRKHDYFDEFVRQNAVWTGGDSGGTGKKIYPLKEFDRGDIVLVRRGTKGLGGIAIILENGYQPDGFDDDKSIKVIWLTKENKWIDDVALGQWDGFSRATENTIQKFRKVYLKTFELIEQIKIKQKTMVNHSINKYKNIILQGPPGTGKTRMAKQIALWLADSSQKDMSLIDAVDKQIFTGDPDIEGNEQIQLIQFHPSYSYEDFVRGIKTIVTDENQVKYEVENKVLTKIASEAYKPQNQSKAYVLIIDEINRANLSSVLGELIYALEYRGKSISSMYEFEGNNEILLPHNLYIIGTMNSADRSVGHIDYAIRRRFSFIPVPSNLNAITQPKARELFGKIKNIFDQFTATDFNKADVIIGHSYFLCNDDEIAMKLKYDIKPLLMEYVKDGILKNDAEPLIEKLSV